MPVTKSAKKKLRKDKKKQKINAEYKNLLTKLVKRAEKKLSEKSVLEAIRATDKAARKHIIHHKKAARIKSKLHLLLHKKLLKTKPKNKIPEKKKIK